MAKLRKESWLHLAKLLEPNTRRYRDHVDCGAGRTLVVSAGEQGWSAHCFRCNADGYELYGQRNLTELRNANYGLVEYKARAFERGGCELPLDFTKEIPDEHAIWLYRAGIYKATSEEYGFGFSRSLQRVILPVWEDNKLVFMQARATDGRKPKYLNNAAVSKRSVLFKGHTMQGFAVVITEDILSAVRVACLSTPAVSTLGTSLSDEQAFWISSNYSKACIWYDGDAAGTTGSTTAARKLRMLGVPVRCIATLKDPKCHSNREMRSILKEFI